MQTGAARAMSPGTDVARDLRRWTIEEALPLWASNGVDRARGGFHERLSADGSPDVEVPRRLLVQARQIYVFAHAADLSWFPEGRSLAVEAAAFVFDRYRSTEGGYVFSVAPDNSVSNPLRDTYAHMFLVLALAWVVKITGDAQFRARLVALMNFIDEHLTEPDGTYREGMPPSLPRRQNPHMHAFEAMLALHETIAYPDALNRARRILDLLLHRFLDSGSGTLGEYFSQDWIPLAAPEGDRIEPGHHAEWSWLIRKYERLSRTVPGALASSLLTMALRGRDAASGLLLDELQRDGSARKTSSRVWPQTELARAFLAEADIGGQDARNQAAQTLQIIRSKYLTVGCRGGLIDCLGPDGLPLTQHMPATALYHVFGAIADAHQRWG